MTDSIETPWQRAFAKLGMTQNALAREMGRHRSKISVHLKDPVGAINGRDQVELLRIARDRKVKLRANDLVPEVK